MVPRMGQSETVPSGFAEEIGIEWLSLDPDGAGARIAIEPRHLQPYGIVHGGVFASLAESLTSAATFEAVREDEMVAMGQARPAARDPVHRVPRWAMDGSHPSGNSHCL